MVRGNGNGFSNHLFKCGNHGLIEGYTPLEEDSFPDGPVSHHPVQVVVTDRIGKPGNQVFFECALLLMIHQIGLHENGAAFSQRDR